MLAARLALAVCPASLGNVDHLRVQLSAGGPAGAERGPIYLGCPGNGTKGKDNKVSGPLRSERSGCSPVGLVVVRLTCALKGASLARQPCPLRPSTLPSAYLLNSGCPGCPASPCPVATGAQAGGAHWSVEIGEFETRGQVRGERCAGAGARGRLWRRLCDSCGALPFEKMLLSRQGESVAGAVRARVEFRQCGFAVHASVANAAV